MYRTDSNAAVRFPVNAAPARVHDAAPHARYRSRDFGVGYGTSSGYAAARRYAPNASPSRFRLV